MAINFASALETKASDVEKPPVLPQGTYRWQVTKHTISEVRSAKGEWDVIEFQVQPIAGEDVDEDELAAFGNLKMGTNRISFMFTKDPDKETEVARTLYQLKNFLITTLQVDGDENSSIKELLAGSTHCQFMAHATWRQVEDNTYVDVKGWAPLD